MDSLLLNGSRPENSHQANNVYMLLMWRYPTGLRFDQCMHDTVTVTEYVVIARRWVHTQDDHKEIASINKWRICYGSEIYTRTQTAEFWVGHKDSHFIRYNIYITAS